MYFKGFLIEVDFIDSLNKTRNRINGLKSVRISYATLSTTPIAYDKRHLEIILLASFLHLVSCHSLKILQFITICCLRQVMCSVSNF